MAVAKKGGKHCGRLKAMVDVQLAMKLRSQRKILAKIVVITEASEATVSRLLRAIVVN